MNKPTHKTPVEILTELHACRGAQNYVHGNNHTPESAWLACKRGDWLLWYANKSGRVDRKQIVFIACQCVRPVLPHTQDPRVKACIETTEAWTRGEAIIEQVRAAAAAVNAADNAAHAATYAATYVAANVAGAAIAIAADADPSAAIAVAADAAAAALAAADAYGTRTKAQKQCADIVRQHIPTLP